MRPATAAERHPALNILLYSRWDDAFAWLHGMSTNVATRVRLDEVLACSASASDRAAVQVAVAGVIEDLYSIGTLKAGALALAWSMLTVNPRVPVSFHGVLPQLQHLVDSSGLAADDDADLLRRLRTWWQAAEGEFNTASVSIFRLADPESECWPDPLTPELEVVQPSTSQTLFVDLGLPTLVVLPASKASKLNNYHAAFKDLIDVALPLVVVRDLRHIRAELHAEFPHAVAAVDLLLRDLREGRPFKVKPICMLGEAGSGKSRLARRICDLASMHVLRFDGAVADGQFAGTAKGWSNTEASVPARAVAQSRTANPVVLIDEIDKCKDSSNNGFLAHALLSFLDVETARRYRDQSLDAEMDLSAISFISTANEVARLPAMLRDRFRIVRVPTPTLAHLPQLAASVMRDLAAEDQARAGDEPLAVDELDVIGKAWARARFSMRSLQKIVAATLEARDQHALRH